MPEPSPAPTSQTPDSTQALRNALGKALAFTVNPATALIFSTDQIKAFAEEETSFGKISVDQDGITTGMKLHLIQPAQDLAADWAHAKRDFVTALQPFKRDIDAVERLDEEVQDLKARRITVREQIEREGMADPEYVHLKSELELKSSVFKELHNRVGLRKVVMGSYSLWYWIGMLFIGFTEWLINYDTFLIFMGVPAIAAGTTIILGILLAFSAHGHGTLLKQWAARFGRDVTAETKRSGLLFLCLSTLGLFIVLGAAGGFRYASVIHLVGAQGQINILGSQATIVIHPARDVLLSLLANLAAWVVGVFLAYLCHDESPELMGANHEYIRARQQFTKKQRPYTARIKREEAQIEREVNEKERSAVVRARGVTEQREMLQKMHAHEQSIIESMLSATRRNLGIYHDQLYQVVASRVGSISISQGEMELTPYQFKATTIHLDPGRFDSSIGHW